MWRPRERRSATRVVRICAVACAARRERREQPSAGEGRHRRSPAGAMASRGRRAHRFSPEATRARPRKAWSR
jgi:hypothetical protein